MNFGFKGTSFCRRDAALNLNGNFIYHMIAVNTA